MYPQYNNADTKIKNNNLEQYKYSHGVPSIN